MYIYDLAFQKSNISDYGIKKEIGFHHRILKKKILNNIFKKSKSIYKDLRIYYLIYDKLLNFK